MSPEQRSPDHSRWDEIDGAGEKRSPALRSLLRQEREAMEKHACEAGCELIIDPYVPYQSRGPGARRARLETLVEFLDGMPDDKVRVAVNRGHIDGSLFIIGDWFVSEAFIPRHDVGGGYRLTLFARRVSAPAAIGLGHLVASARPAKTKGGPRKPPLQPSVNCSGVHFPFKDFLDKGRKV
jgi:hypothetical protein